MNSPKDTKQKNNKPKEPLRPTQAHMDLLDEIAENDCFGRAKFEEGSSHVTAVVQYEVSPSIVRELYNSLGGLANLIDRDITSEMDLNFTRGVYQLLFMVQGESDLRVVFYGARKKLEGRVR